jgi:hypothetical protein
MLLQQQLVCRPDNYIALRKGEVSLFQELPGLITGKTLPRAGSFSFGSS